MLTTCLVQNSREKNRIDHAPNATLWFHRSCKYYFVFSNRRFLWRFRQIQDKSSVLLIYPYFRWHQWYCRVQSITRRFGVEKISRNSIMTHLPTEWPTSRRNVPHMETYFINWKYGRYAAYHMHDYGMITVFIALKSTTILLDRNGKLLTEFFQTICEVYIIAQWITNTLRY